jgi:predicted nucleic-acid-binding protein
MKTIFVDTNVFMRYLTNDFPVQAERVERLFDLAEQGDVRLLTGPPVFFELAWTLKSFYKMDRKGIYECLHGLLGLPGLQIMDLEILEEALESYRQTSADFSDAYVAASSRRFGADAVATFNTKHFAPLDVILHTFA